MPIWTKKQIRGFHNAAESLKLYRRADLQNEDDGSSLIDEIYVDPLPENQVINTIIKPNTTFLVGRKGTGKSTIFQKLQSELRKSKSKTSAYIDIKTVFESSQFDPALILKLQQYSHSLPQETLEKLLLYKAFIKQIIKDIRLELSKRVNSNLWTKAKELFTGNIDDLFIDFDKLVLELEDDHFINVLGIKITQTGTTKNDANSISSKDSSSLKIAEKPEASFAYEQSINKNHSTNNEIKYEDILLKTFNIKDFIIKIKELLQKLGIRNLYILIDDFSELPEEAMKVVVDVLLSPLNNWSDEFIKFKIAAYPGRIYYGNIDRTKIDEIYLDIYKLYGSNNLPKMEASAIDFTKRLVDKRIKNFCKCTSESFFDNHDSDLWKNLFYATMANPRNLGYLLHFINESHIIHQKTVGNKAIRDAAERYYTEKIEPYLSVAKFLHATFNEKSSTYSLKELLESIVTKAKSLRNHDSAMLRKIAGSPYTSHFHVLVKYESLFSTLELNFFLTKYYEMTDRLGKKVAVYALNYGLCSKYTIRFGRPNPAEDVAFRLYYIERFFDYTPLINDYLTKNQEIICTTCETRYSFDQLEAIRFYNMKCPNCQNGTIKVANLSLKYQKELEEVDQDILLPPVELGILQTLYSEGKPLRPSAIAGELDCSYQLIGKRGKILYDKSLVEREQDDTGKRIFTIRDEAVDRYFDNETRLDVPDDHGSDEV